MGSPEPPDDAADVGGALSDLRSSVAALGSAFRSRDLAKALVAYLGFSISEWAAFIALIVYAYEDGGSLMVGAISLLQLIPAALLAPIGAVLGDRHRRERVLLLAYATLATTTALAALALLAGAPAPLVYGSATVAGWTMVLIRPTHASLLPRLARTPEELTSAYAATGLLESTSILIGPLLAGAVMGLAGASVSGPGLVDAALALLLLGGTFAVSAIRVRTEPAHHGGTDLRAVAGEAGAGVRAVARDRRSLLLVLTMGLTTIQLGFVDVLIVVLAFDVLGTGDAGVGFLNAAIGVGAIVGAVIAVAVALRWRSSRSFRLGISLSGLSVATIAAQPALAGGLLAVAGAGGTLADVNGRLMLQRLIPDKQLSRAFGVLESLYMAGEGIGSFLASVLVVAVGPRWTLLIGGVLLPSMALAARRGLMALDVGVRVPAEEIALLRATPVFAPLPVPILERLARNLVPTHVPSGTTVIRQGEHGDRFYVLVEGTVEVTADGRAVGSLGPGGTFGEIALIRDVPRTATVTATSDARLVALDRDEFLRVVTGHEPTERAVHELAAERLAELDRPDG
ncbi:MAG TPA: MFS transporter [Actinomycetota bacterium]|nr:MFS transporter [Actinomycetota bacterium]